MRQDRYRRASFARKAPLGRLVLGFSGFILAVSIAAGTAWSLDDQAKIDQKAVYVVTLAPQAGDVIDPAPRKISRNSSMNSGCSPLLETVRYTPQRFMGDDRRSAGAAVLGLAFGMRYALTPPEELSPVRSRRIQTCS